MFSSLYSLLSYWGGSLWTTVHVCRSDGVSENTLAFVSYESQYKYLLFDII